MAGIALTDDEIARLSEEQLASLEELGIVAAKKLKLTGLLDEMSQVTTVSQKQMGFSKKAVPTALHEDPEIQQLLTIKVRYKMGNLNEQIKRILRRCVELGLDKYAIIQRQCANYNVPCSTTES
jgi:hypothetical protein